MLAGCLLHIKGSVMNMGGNFSNITHQRANTSNSRKATGMDGKQKDDN